MKITFFLFQFIFLTGASESRIKFLYKKNSMDTTDISRNTNIRSSLWNLHILGWFVRWEYLEIISNCVKVDITTQVENKSIKIIHI